MLVLSEIKTLEALKAKGSFKKVMAEINKLIPIKARGWKHLWEKILELRKYAENDDLVHAAIFFKTEDLAAIKKYLWMVIVTLRQYNLYISSMYEGINYFKYENSENEVRWN
ncbi:hypothetical protein HZS38_13720 [Xenorhabdus nematophila]|uniref:Uncharacterized protein n=1 Tax=Xenorhabdus nematophila (strain ATCC 19061 / DSM 3370 / CCUG 14189 / LMG 1036 / NCIMB 9965 / AN6) TaxID=406817 RepID=D3VHW1_XENNA|nr:hypothetical protein [Xenorhabdus nematophila]CEE90122.1 hypothetical protein XNA1_120009 [Xenorhabdus nematophila str. Anatoliense]CEF31654.1 hypothetical protein XNW1_3850148 [Xenorhabdus nematophila str. Websteri]AYA41416.1 hypothetical protein D3790_13980 [Xenorhabdus nematophila]KHD29742.1 hypothetical protein LH67_00065 [Xenorhabdus nematophila]MBA0020154.1 hypothetical protein [Xenorhabdus nematophila]